MKQDSAQRWIAGRGPDLTPVFDTSVTPRAQGVGSIKEFAQ